MIIEESIEANITSDVSTEDVTMMTIDLEALPHLMDTLTNLYKDPQAAVIREYFTNALDAHSAIESNEKVEVTLPTWSSPVYIVKDVGVGMSAENMREILSKYGASTKRGTNNQIGAYGLGFKSALTISTQFTLISVKDGLKTTALVSKTESGVNSVSIVSVVESDDHSGTTVKIPVDDYYQFTGKALKFFKYADKEKFFLTNNTVDCYFDDAARISDEDDNSLGYAQLGVKYMSEPVTIVMGDVPYHVTKSSLIEFLSVETYSAIDSLHLVIPMPIGTINLTPNREGIRFTDKTKTALTDAIETILSRIKMSAVGDFNSVSRSKIWETQNKWAPLLASEKWKGEEVIDSLEVINTELYRTENYSQTQSYARMYLNRERTIIVPDDYDGFVRYATRNIRTYMRGINSSEAMRLSVVPHSEKDLLKTEWVTDNNLIEFISEEDFRKVCSDYRKANRKAPTKRTGSSAPRGPVGKAKYPVLFPAKGELVHMEYDTIPNNILYVSEKSTTEYYPIPTGSVNVVDSHRLEKFMDMYSVLDLDVDTGIAFITKNRSLDAFLRLYPEAKNISTKFKSLEARYNKLSTSAKLLEERKHIHSSTLSKLKSLVSCDNLEQFRDPDVKKALKKLSKMHSNPLEDKINSYKNFFTYHRVPIEQHYYYNSEDIFAYLADRYPLVLCIARYNAQDGSKDSVIYMNAKYQAIKKSKVAKNSLS